MPTPVFHFRLPLADRKNLEEMAKVVGKPPSTFARDIVAVVCSGDLVRISAFNADLRDCIAKQLPLPLEMAPTKAARIDIPTIAPGAPFRTAMRQAKRAVKARRARGEP